MIGLLLWLGYNSFSFHTILSPHINLLCQVFFVFFCSFALNGVVHGTGQHVTELPLEEIPLGLKVCDFCRKECSTCSDSQMQWWWACEPVYVLSNISLKLSISIFLLRITISRTHRMIIYTVIVTSSVYSAFFFFLFVLQCRPSNYFWTRYTGGTGSCMDPKITVDATYAYSAVSCLADWTLGIVPVFIIWNLQMNPRTKLSVALILAVGAMFVYPFYSDTRHVFTAFQSLNLLP